MITDIKELDRVLGYDPDSDLNEHGSIPLGSVVLIRGHPGSGKTTLALQIIDRYLRKDRRFAAFVSLESEPHPTVNHASEAFDFHSLKRGANGKVPHLVELNRGEFSVYLDKNKKVTGREFAKKVITTIAEAFDNDEGEPTAILDGSNTILIVIDSLMLLVDLISTAQDTLHHDTRSGLNYIREATKSILDHAIIIYTGEYRPHGSIIDESFYCDIEIILSPEPIAGIPIRSADTISPIGYNVERTNLGLPHTQAVVSRSFCRVLKNRHWPNHSRRCAYDIVNKRVLPEFSGVF